MTEIQVGSIFMIAEPTDAPHVLVILRGKGEPGQRPLLGQVTMSREEWQDVCDHIEQDAVDEEAFRRIGEAVALVLEAPDGRAAIGAIASIADALDSRDGGNHRTAADFPLVPTIEPR